MEWRESKDEEHELLIKFLKGEEFERFLLGFVTVGFFLAMIAGAVILLVNHQVGVLRAVIMIVFGFIGVLIMLLAFKGDGKMKLARAKSYHICDCRVRDRVVSTGYKRATYNVNVIANSGKRYKVKVNGSICRQAKEGRRAFIVGYLPGEDGDKLPWDLIIRKDLDDEEL